MYGVVCRLSPTELLKESLSPKNQLKQKHQRPPEVNKKNPFHPTSSPNNLSTMQFKGNPQIPIGTELFRQSTLHLIDFLFKEFDNSHFLERHFCKT